MSDFFYYESEFKIKKNLREGARLSKFILQKYFCGGGIGWGAGVEEGARAYFFLLRIQIENK